MIRVAKPHDIEVIAAGWRRVLESNGVIRPDRKQSIALVRECVTGGFVLVSYERGPVRDELKGAILARRHARLWKHRYQATIVGWWSETGDGFRMLRSFLDWADSRKDVRKVAMYTELDYDPRLLKALRRYGFEPGGMLTIE